jgi:hypothetical protein
VTDEATGVEHVDSVDELVERIHLADVITYELRGRRRDGEFDDLSPVDDIPDGQVRWNSKFGYFQNHQTVALRAKNYVDSDKVELVVDIAAVFVKDGAFAIDDQVLGEFLGLTGVMALYPYLRHSVQDLSTRLGAPVTLDLMTPSILAARTPSDL